MSWQEQLVSASTEAQVIAVVRSYLAQLPEETLALMPPELRQAAVTDVTAVAGLAVAAAKAELATAYDAPGVLVLRDASMFFASAAVRITTLTLKRTVGSS
jgi:hypothetical protein